MKKNSLLKKKNAMSAADREKLRFWKHSSTRAKLEWLESAFYFGKLRKFRKS